MDKVHMNPEKLAEQNDKQETVKSGVPEKYKPSNLAESTVSGDPRDGFTNVRIQLNGNAVRELDAEPGDRVEAVEHPEEENAIIVRPKDRP